jgi:RNA polymerase subunit RPABC4/transcription elongation factor Spt4
VALRLALDRARGCHQEAAPGGQVEADAAGTSTTPFNLTTESDQLPMGFLVDGRCQCGYESRGLTVGVGMKHGPDTWLSPCACGRCQAIVAANVRAAPITCPKCRGKSVVPLVDPDHGCEDDEAFPSCQASEPLMEESFACPACGKRQLRFRFAGLWD